jgi:hypothetical protein
MWCGRVAREMFLRGRRLWDVAPYGAGWEGLKSKVAEDKISGARLVSGCSSAQHVTDYERKEAAIGIGKTVETMMYKQLRWPSVHRIAWRSAKLFGRCRCRLD